MIPAHANGVSAFLARAARAARTRSDGVDHGSRERRGPGRAAGAAPRAGDARDRGGAGGDDPGRADALEPGYRSVHSRSHRRDLRHRRREAARAASPASPEPEKEEPKAAPTVAAPKEAKLDNTPPPAAAAAKASEVLTQAPNPDEPVDLTNSFVTGNADTYAGGVTQANGTSDSAVYARKVAPGGVPAEQARPRRCRHPASSIARAPPSLAGSKDWKCDFPPEADVEQIDQAFVIVQVATRADGTPDHVSILSDPGHGFARAARICAMQERYDPAFDHDGNAIAGLTKSIRVRFER